MNKATEQNIADSPSEHGWSLSTAPPLPYTLLTLALLFIVTHVWFVLVEQPIDYWVDYSRASSLASLQKILMISPWLFAGVSLTYLLVVGLVLRHLPRPQALVLWIGVCFFHWRSILFWAWCGVEGIVHLKNNCGNVDLLLALITTGLLGVALVRGVRPGSLAPSKRFSLITIGLAAVWLLFLTMAFVRATDIPNTGWVPVVATTHPPARIDGVIAYDTKRQTAVLFGGASNWEGGDWVYKADTWEWDGVNWTQRTSPNSPAGRISHAMAYDEQRGVVVLFGGKNETGVLGDTWEWDGERWQRYPGNAPARCCHRLFYDSQRGHVVLYGGYWSGPPETFFNDAWEWDGVQWLPIMSATAMPKASNFDIVYDEAQRQAVAFFGGDPYGTWLWREEGWAKPSLTAEPPYRLSFDLAYNPLTQQVILFGGSADNQFFQDTWLFDGKGWQELDSPRFPASRWGHTLFYDEQRQRIMLFGGFDGTNYYNDLWELVLP